ncbi:MAG: RNA-binding S4 domain-containing protein [Alphaproteobacteria bacterium]|nr:RNA-binding S4 domain-containing protein [Alphaproteobacteria bacterium]MCZ6510777.1 RNA-binding S4 domain-containing protein [Alphaproteobacteria bacterium]MCZ6587152.1 RNA-binding S4 domain-containing protein [Alphaproteobacteria bacterium]MCZ6592303.1 RNA-binding S4 domain-containing protein [Alphaproteobacteria bacterium]MCZ6838367.1 RNA-binding S4 domain-containing protein [Alphaproteobacteria bacterium]
MVETDTLRLDKWLWFTRLCKTRTQATALCRTGRVRVNRTPVRKPNHALRLDDVLTFPLGRRIWVVRVVALGERRGPFREAQTLYEDLSPPPVPPAERSLGSGQRDRGAGRPTKRDRRAIDQLNDPGNP